MIHVNWPGLAILITTLVLPGISRAMNWHWLNDSAIKSFTEKDWEMLGNAVDNALDHFPDHTTVEWSNPENHHSGTVQVLNTRKTDSGVCRTAVLKNQAEGKEGSSRVNLCRQPDNSWKIVPETPDPKQ